MVSSTRLVVASPERRVGGLAFKNFVNFFRSPKK